MILGNTITQLQSVETSDMPADERLKAIDFVSVNVIRNEGRVMLALNVVSQTNEVMPVVVPISIVP
jgi:hypothetical protein